MKLRNIQDALNTLKYQMETETAMTPEQLEQTLLHIHTDLTSNCELRSQLEPEDKQVIVQAAQQLGRSQPPSNRKSKISDDFTF